MQSTMARAKWAPLNREEEEVHLVAKFSNISHMAYGRTKQLGGDASSLVSSPLPAAILMGQKVVWHL